MAPSEAYEDLGYTSEQPTQRPAASASIAEDPTPTPDQIYLADAISKVAPKGPLSTSMLYRLNRKYGVSVVTEALRMARGFGRDIHSAYGYVDNLCRRAK